MAHLYETGRMGRVHLHGHGNIIIRLLIHACSLNLGLLIRNYTGSERHGERRLRPCVCLLVDARFVLNDRF